jgi:hypothetical protein
MGFTEPSRSPGLLVSSYLAVSPLPQPRRKHLGRGGLFSVALSLSAGCVKQPWTVGVTHHRALRSPDFPPRHVLRCALPGRFPALAAQIQAPRRSSRPPRPLYRVYVVLAKATTRPATPALASSHKVSRRQGRCSRPETAEPSTPLLIARPILSPFIDPPRPTAPAPSARAFESPAHSVRSR